MVENSPSSREVNDFHFKQLRKLKIFKDDFAPQNYINLLAASNRFGLIFIGVNQGFKVLKLEDILNLDEDKDKIRIEAEEYPHQLVELPSTPQLIRLSADDLTLSVCLSANGVTFAELFDIRTFANQGIHSPFMTVHLSSKPDVKLKDLIWNPAASGVFAVCLSDGSVNVQELSNEFTSKVIASLEPTTGATAACWSPKGKQLVVGKKDGSFTQYKPSLQEVKTFAAPKIMEKPVSVLNIHWISTTLFALAYVPADENEEKVPYLILATAQKGGAITFTNYSDVCFGNGFHQEARYLMYHQPEWSILVCSSSSSLETAILGTNADKSAWQQWLLEDTGRAELPLFKEDETFPLGMAVISCSQKPIQISDTEIYAPVPILLLISTRGLLCPFHMLNRFPGATNVVSPPEILSPEGERKCKDVVPSLIPPRTAAPPSRIVPITQLSNLPTSPQLQIEKPQAIIPQSRVTYVPPQKPAVITETPFSPNQMSPQIQPQLPTVPRFVTPTIDQHTFTASASPVTAHLPRSVPAKRVISYKLNSVGDSGDNIALESLKQSEEAALSPKEADTFIASVLEEIATFEKELLEFKERSSRCKEEIGTKDEMAQIKNSSQLLTDFSSSMKETMQSISSDVSSLSNSVLETFAMYEEAHSQEMRNKDPHYLLLLRNRSLDPISYRKMQEIRNMSQYLDSQLREVHNILDHDWNEFLEKNKKVQRRIPSLPTNEALYRTVLNNQNLISSKLHYVEKLIEKFKKEKPHGRQYKGYLDTTSLHSLPKEEELSTLADILLKTKISTSTSEKTPAEGSEKRSLSVSKQSALREFLCNREINVIKPRAIKKLSDSMLISNLALIKKKEKLKEIASTGTILNKETRNSMKTVTAVVSDSPQQFIKSSSTVSVPFLTLKPVAQMGVGGITLGTPATKTYTFSIPLPGQNQSLKSDESSGPVDSNKSEPDFLKGVPSQSAFTNISPASSLKISQQAIQSAASTSVFSSGMQSIPSDSATNVPPKLGTGVKLGSSSSIPFSNTQLSGAAPCTFLPVERKTTPKLSSSIYENITPPETPQPGTEVREVEEEVEESEAEEQKIITVEFINSGNDKANGVSVSSYSASSTDIANAGFPLNFTSSLSPKSDSAVKLSIPAVSGQPKVLVPTLDSKDSTSTSTNKLFSFTFNKELQSSSLTPTVSISEVSPFSTVSSAPSKLSSPAETAKFPSLTLNPSVPEFTPKQTIPLTSTASSISNTVAFTQQNSPSFVSVPSSTTAQITSENAPEIIKSGTVTASPVSFVQTSGTVNNLKSTPAQPVATTVLPAFGQSNAFSVFSQNNTSTPLTSTKQSSTPTNSTSSLFQLPASSPSLFSKSTPQTTSVFGQTTSSIFGQTSSMFGQGNSSFFGQPKPAANTTSSQSTEGNSTEAITTANSTASATSLFGQTAPSATSLTSSSSSAFGQTSPATPPPSVFGQSLTGSVATTTSAPVFGQSITGSVTTTTTAPVFGQSVTASAGTTTSASVFGQTITAPTTTATTTTATLFGQSIGSTASPSLFGQSTPITSTSQSIFGQTTTTSSTTPSFFGQPTGTTSFFSKSGTSLFGQPAATSSGFGQTSVFGQSGNSVFGSPTTPTSGFGQQSSPGSTSVFGQPSMPTSFSFGQNSSVFGQKSVFGQSGNSVFGQQQNNSPFGQTSPNSGTSFGQSSGFFSGLGGKPSAENASKNVFGTSSSFGNNPQTSNLFGNQGASTFGTKLGSFTGGSFSGGNEAASTAGNAGSSPSVLQTGFAAFQQTPQKSGFGASSTFGGSPSFGGSPGQQFGSGATFSNPLTTSPFSNPLSASPASQPSGFGNFAATNAPTFGTLASQGQNPTFGNITQQPPQAPTFGTLNQSPGFGFDNPPSPSTFGGQNTAFGVQSPSASPSAFSQWRQ